MHEEEVSGKIIENKGNKLSRTISADKPFKVKWPVSKFNLKLYIYWYYF